MNVRIPGWRSSILTGKLDVPRTIQIEKVDSASTGAEPKHLDEVIVAFDLRITIGSELRGLLSLARRVGQPRDMSCHRFVLNSRRRSNFRQYRLK